MKVLSSQRRSGLNDRYRRARPVTLVIAMATFLLSVNVNCVADESWDRVKLSAGAFDIFRHDSTTSLTETNSGLGVSFTPLRLKGATGSPARPLAIR